MWTPLLTPFVQTDRLGPKGLGFLLYGGRVERNLKGHIAVFSRVCLVGPLPFLRDDGVVDGAEVERGRPRKFLAFLVNLLTWTGSRVNNSLTGAFAHEMGSK